MSNSKASLGDRIKQYEVVFKQKLLRKTPVIIRVDGKAFHTFTRKVTSEIDPSESIGPGHMLHYVMVNTAKAVCEQMQNCQVAYTQSDEISFLLRDWDRHETEQWFDASVQKIASIAASLATGYFAQEWRKEFSTNELAFFDARVFNLPMNEVVNYFIWRQQDWTRNSVQMIGRKFFSHKQLYGKNNSEIQDMLMDAHEVNWNDYADWKKRGTCVYRTTNGFIIDETIPIFTQDREYIRRHLDVPDE